MQYDAVSENLNIDLCALESATLMLIISNNQYKEATRKNLSESVINYFDEKNSAYSYYRESLMQEINEFYYKAKLQLKEAIEQAKPKLWQNFLKKYPDCKATFEEAFTIDSIVYEPFVTQFETNLKNNVTDEDQNNIIQLFGNYASNFVAFQQLNNYNILVQDIYSQVNEFGAKAFIFNKHQSNVEVPIWAIREVVEENFQTLKNVKSDLRLCGIKTTKIGKKFQKDPDNKELSQQYVELCDDYDYIKTTQEFHETINQISNGIYQRSYAATNKWRANEVRGVLQEKLQEWSMGIEKNLRNFYIERKTIFACKEEINRIVELTKYSKETFEAGLVLAHYAEIPYELYIDEYEYTKDIVKTEIKNTKANAKNKFELENEIKTGTDTPEVIAEKTDTIKEINDCAVALESNFVFETPFGLMKLHNGEIINVNTNQVYPVEKLDEYFVENGNVTKFDKLGKIQEVQKIEDIKIKLNAHLKNNNVTPLTSEAMVKN